MDSEDVVESTFRLQRSLQKFIDHVEELGSEDDPTGDGFTREFKVIRDLGLRMREENTYPADEGRKPFNIKKNRYKDILPFDSTRVILDKIAGEDGSDYINANFIQDLNGFNAYIASQGPVPLTVYDFLRMIRQYKVKVVAMACRCIEMGKKKCEEYWPSEVNETIEFRDITVTMTNCIEIGEHCTRRELCLSSNGSDSHTVTQFHYTGWPDHDIPHDFDVILEMIAEMREIKRLDTNKAPMVIHCSAGCGRTGTICAIDYSWDLLKSGNLDENFSLYDIVKKMREQRQSMIQAPEQYRMAHITVQTLFQKHLDLMEDHTYGNLEFGDATEDTGKHTDDGIYSHVSDAESVGSSLGVPSQGQRKDSILSQEIISTIAKATHHTSHDDLMTPVRETVPISLQEPLTPAVYEAEPLSPTVKELKGKFLNESSEPSKAYPIVKIDNIPSGGSGGIEKRYLNNVNKEETSLDRKLSFMPSESRKQDLESKKKFYENTQVASSEQNKAHTVKPSVETNNNKPIIPKKTPESVTKPVERIHSKQTDNKHVTVLSIGGMSSTRTPVNKTLSAPAQNATKSPYKTRPTTLPASRNSNPFQESPQSSVPPTPPSQQTESLYTYAGNSSFFTSVTNDKTPVQSSTLAKDKTNNLDSGTYSELSNYHSGSYSVAVANPYSDVDEGQGNTGRQLIRFGSNNYSYATERVMSASDPYSAVDVNKVGNPADHIGANSSQTYSFAREPSTDHYSTVDVNNIGRQSKHQDSNCSQGYSCAQPILGNNIYSSVQKTETTSQKQQDALYETLDITKPSGDKVPPPIPDRGYIEDDNDRPGDTSTLRRKAQQFKNLFTGRGGPSNTASNDIPGYPVKFGRIPGGPRDKPLSWR